MIIVSRKMRIVIAISSVVIIVLSITIYYYVITPKEEGEELSDVLNIYNWEDYFGETTLADFEEEFGVKVNLDTYEDEDIMFSTVQSNPAKYDIIIASDAWVRDMIKLRLLAKLDMKNIPNFKNIDDKFQNPPYDPGNNYSVPYMWGTTGIGVNTKFVTGDVDSWSILWNSTYKGKMCMLNNMDEVIGAALKYLGYSLNSRNTSQLQEAKQILLEQKSLLRGYDDCIDIQDDLILEELWLSHEYGGEVAFAADSNENITYVIPKEGAGIWVDNLIIPVGSPHKYTAEVFMNFLLRAKVSADIAIYLWYANTNEAAREFTDPEILEDPSIYPPPDILERCEYFEELDGATISIHNQIWAELQAP